eukprot:scaffold5069_cov126-Skeletonema_menzelii.AAC.4
MKPLQLLLLTAPLLAQSVVYQVQHYIPRRNTECIYSDFQAGQTATFELFIIESPAGRLSAGVQIEGPIASDKIGEVVKNDNGEETGERTSKRVAPADTWDPNRYAQNPHELSLMGSLMQDAITNWPRFLNRHGNDFQSKGIIHHFFHIDYTHSGADEDAIRARAEITRQIQQDENDRRRRLMEERNLGQREMEEVYEQENRGRMERVLPDRIAPYEWTKRIKSSGWYRLCVQADEDILVEMDIRNSAVFGGVNQETGHVWTFADWEEWEEEERINKLDELKEQAKKDEEARALLEQVNSALKDQVKGYDLESTQRLMTEINTLVSQMQQMQSAVHQRIKSHEGIAKRNHQKIKKSGVVETLLYLLITGYQVYTVHNWLLSTNSLGR